MTLRAFTPASTLLLYRSHRSLVPRVSEIPVQPPSAAALSAVLLLPPRVELRLPSGSMQPTEVAFDDESVADFFDAQVDQGRKSEQFARLWLHTHPGDCPQPSLTDEQTFVRVFGRVQWAVMFILAQQGQTYARLRFNVGPGGAVNVPVEVDYSRPFSGSDVDAWEQEYLANVNPEEIQLRAVNADRVNGDHSIEMQPSELDDPFFVGDEAEWLGLWSEPEPLGSE